MAAKRINVVTLGCSKNLVDSEKMMKQLQAGGYEVVHDDPREGASVVIINTCGFISDAKEESIDTILKYVKARKAGKLEKLFVTGCLSQRYAEDLRKEIPEVDEYFGVNSLPDIITSLQAGNQRAHVGDRMLTGPGHYAYLKVSEGCDKKCAFCAIPMIRGKHVSRPIEELLEEASILSDKGVKELILIAQDLTYYGMDIYDKRSVAELVEKLDALNRFEWIRLHYLYPSSFPLHLLSVIRDLPKVCRYIDLPIQHISDRVLKNMARSHSEAATRSLLDKIRMEIPDAAIRTTLIVGHPGEEETDFEQLRNFVREFRFDRLGVFTYSHEEKTPAGNRYDDLIPQEVKENRKAEIMAIQQEISSELNSKMVGRSLPVMIDRREGEWLVGRTEYDSPEIDQEVLIPFSAKIKTGTINLVKITGSGDFDLFGEFI
jgi:ribosomal protein S12 methylthiotransferase